MERLVTAVAPHGLYHFGKATDAALNAQPGGHHVLTPAHRDHESAYAVPPERKQPAGFRFDEAMRFVPASMKELTSAVAVSLRASFLSPGKLALNFLSPGRVR